MEQQRILAYDRIRALAIVFVVLIHSSERLWYETAFFLRLENAVFLSIVEMAVPLFLMISGALLLGKEEPTGLFFKKRVSRLLLPFLIWSLVVFSLTRIMEGNYGLSDFLPAFGRQLLTGQIHGIYWFVYALIGIYLLTPVLRIVCREKRPTLYLLILTGLLSLCQQFVPSFEISRQMMAPFVHWLFCFLAGYAASRFLAGTPATKYILWACLCVFVIDVFVRFSHTPVLPPERFTAIGLFILMLKKSPEKISPITALLSKYSYGIFLSHFLLISAFLRLVGESLPVALQPFIVTAVVLPVNFLIFRVADKLRLLKLVG